jgi:O-antigen ligase
MILYGWGLRKNLALLFYGGMMGGLIAFFLFMGFQNRYLYHAPDFTTTIQHHDLNAHLQATYGVKDVSNAERLYRWIAGVRMAKARPWFGFGPGNFYSSYKPYTVKSFTTYVSDNEERSTVHNYYLLSLIEQGLPGCIIFITLVTLVLYYGQTTYNKMPAGFDRSFLVAAYLCFVVILFNITANDMIETDKVGSCFYMCIAFIANARLKLLSMPQGIIKPMPPQVQIQ